MYHDDLHQAAELAHAAVASMTRFSIPPTPINFTIWYEYHAGRDPALSRAIDALLASHKPFTPDTTLQLYEEFLNPARLLRSSRETTEKLQVAMEELRSFVDSAEQDTRAYGDKLERFSGKLPLFGGLDSARFRRQVGPGDTLELTVEMGRLSARAGKGSGTAIVNGELAVSCDLMFVIVDADPAG